MTALPTISLNTGWQYSADGAAWFPLPALEHWPPPLPAPSDTIDLRCRVSLSPTDVCVRYLLHLEAAPEHTEVSINGWQVGTTHGASFSANVTDQVSLGDNVIVLKARRTGAFGRVYLQAVACE